MAIRGAKPTPGPLRVVGDNAKADSIAAETARAKADPMPSPPEWLLQEAKSEWRRLGPRLHAAGLLSALDRGAFAAICQSYGTWVMAEKGLAEIRRKAIAEAKASGEGDTVGAGFVSKTAAGNLVHHPLASIASKAKADYVKTCVEFGLTPSSRARIDTDSAQNRSGGNPARRFFGRAAG